MKLGKKYYQNSLKEHKLKKRYVRRTLLSGLVGGIICVFSQGVLEIAKHYNPQNAVSIMLIIVIFLGVVATGLGVYDNLSQFSYAGTIVPITGFANSVASCAIEYKPEGYLFGVAANSFKLAGSVIVLGVVATIVVGIIRIVLMMI